MRRRNEFSEYGAVATERSVIRSWKHPRGERIALFFAVTISLAMSLFSAIGLVGESEVVITDVFVPVFFLSIGVLLLALAESSIALTSENVQVRNFYKWRIIPLEDIIAVAPGYYGIVIKYSPNGWIVSLASQKSNIASWFRRRAQACAISDEILAAVRSRKDISASGL